MYIGANGLSKPKQMSKIKLKCNGKTILIDNKKIIITRTTNEYRK